MKKISSFLLAVFVAVLMVVSSGIVSESAMAADQCLNADGSPASQNTFLFFRPWYYNVVLDKECSPVIPENDDDGLRDFVWTVILNIIYDLFMAIGTIGAGFVIYAGYLFLTAGGDPGKVAKAKKSLVSSVIGIAVALSARMVITTITTFIGSYPGSAKKPNDEGLVLDGAFKLAFAVAGMVAVGFIIYGGYSYMTSSGDPGKAKKGRTTLIYSIIGLLVVLLAFAIVNFITGSL